MQKIPRFTAEMSLNESSKQRCRSMADSHDKVILPDLIYPSDMVDIGGCTFDCTPLGGRLECTPIMCTA